MTAMAAARGLLSCRVCGEVNRAAVRGSSAGVHGASAVVHCARCGSPLHARKPDSMRRTVAFLAAAYVLYLPANLLPILETGELGGPPRSDTIMSGVVTLWTGGWWPLAVVILIASIFIPFAKLGVLTWLVISVRRGSAARLRGRTRLYRLVDVIGKWSMVDIYVGALLVGLVRFEPLASVSPGPAAIAFGAVVVLTMLASQSFDPRLLWDAAEARRG